MPVQFSIACSMPLARTSFLTLDISRCHASYCSATPSEARMPFFYNPIRGSVQHLPRTILARYQVPFSWPWCTLLHCLALPSFLFQVHWEKASSLRVGQHTEPIVCLTLSQSRTPGQADGKESMPFTQPHTREKALGLGMQGSE